MIIFEDTRNQVRTDKKTGRIHDKHKNIHDYCKSNGIEIIRTKLYCGDYTLATNQSICIDTKKDMVELSQNLFQDHKRFTAELKRATDAGIKLIILIEDNSIRNTTDLINWTNPQPNANKMTPNGARAFKVMSALNSKYGVEFKFCSRKETGEKIIELLTNGNG